MDIKQMKTSPLPFMWIFLVLFITAIVVLLLTNRSNPPSISVPSFVGPTVDTTDAERLLEPSTGTRKALLFGLNYKDTPFQLQGCIDDIRNLGAVLRTAGFDVEVCTDETNARPTRAVIQAKLAAFLLDLAPGDMGVVWYSGHGVLLDDGANAWVPLDFQKSGFVDESWVRAHLAALSPNVRLLIGSDACHSGTTFDLKYDVEPLSVPASISSSYKRVVPIKATARKSMKHVFVTTRDMERDFELLDAWTNRDELPAYVVVLSAARDDEQSAEGFEEGEMQGAMTWAFLDALESFGPSLTLGGMQDSMRAQLSANGYTQTPQLSFSRIFSPKSSFAAFGF